MLSKPQLRDREPHHRPEARCRGGSGDLLGPQGPRWAAQAILGGPRCPPGRIGQRRELPAVPQQAAQDQLHELRTDFERRQAARGPEPCPCPLRASEYQQALDLDIGGPEDALRYAGLDDVPDEAQVFRPEPAPALQGRVGRERGDLALEGDRGVADRKSTRLNSSHSQISYAVFCLKKKKDMK